MFVQPRFTVVDHTLYYFPLFILSITDAQMDPYDCHKFKVIVRSNRTIAHMNKSEPDMSQFLHDGGIDGLQDYNNNNPTGESPHSPVPSSSVTHQPSSLITNHSNGNSTTKGVPPVKQPKYASAPRMESVKFLKAKGKTTFWQLTMRVDNEQACKLAVQHIENKRKDLTANKMEQLRRILNHWASHEADALTKDD